MDQQYARHVPEMHFLHLRKLVLLAALSVIGANAASPQRRQCSQNDANVIAVELQHKFWDASSGSYIGGELWTDANTLEDLHNLMLLTKSNTYETIADGSYIGRAALNPSTNWVTFFGGSYDDAQWVILALWKISDYKASLGQDYSQYMKSSLAIYDMVAAEWDNDVCGGGVWWSSAHTYKNAITNELFLLTSAQAYTRTGNKNETYLQNALKEYKWLMNSGMQGTDGLFNDGLDSTTCKNNGQTTWTYNQAVVSSGLGALYVADGRSNKTLLAQAQVSLDATMHSALTDNDILKESCDDAQAGGSLCDHDQELFKGLWTKHVQYFLDAADDTSITAKYSDFLTSQHVAVHDNAMNATADVGSVWYAPNEGGSEWGPQPSASGLEAVLSATKYGDKIACSA
ncbi:glycoside hydrolase [Tylopilus felleus]